MKNFYQNKTILVTGSTGFKGGWLSFWLYNLGAKVVGYSLKINTEPNLFEAIKLDNKITQIIGDINDLDTLEKACDQHKPEIIFHLAAQPIVRESYENPVYTMQTNAIGTVNVLESTRKKDYIKGAVLITTDKVYENKEWLWPYRENDRLGGFDPYSSSKAMAEIAIDSYKKSFLNKLGKKIAVVRAGNVIGGGDWSKDRLVPDIVRTIMKDEELILRNPNAVRPWQYVLEALYGYLIMGQKIFENDKYCESYNFGPDFNDTMKVVDLVEKSIEILGKGNYKIEISDKNPHEAGLLLLDNTKAKTLLGWKPRYNVNETLEFTINWYKDFYDGKNMEEICLKEINKFNF
ncbi:MAG: CDP-glucose 4,6-dehydratase [Candidatus Gracilibacteria bacterium]|nr:CDP-glucose 4,6-dehydratase [Candidatus Gracilibacteria bacterium]